MSDESLFREVDEEVRQEQFQKLWKRYGNVIIALCFVMVAAVAGFKGWQYWQVKQSETAADSFFAAGSLITDGKPEDALKQYESISHSGYGTLARLRAANAGLAAGKLNDAIKAYDAIAADPSVPAPLRDAARLRAAYALVDTAKPEDLSGRVNGLDTPGNPWRHAARQVMALTMWRAGDVAGARKQVSAMLADGETPAGIRQSARALNDLLLPLVEKK